MSTVFHCDKCKRKIDGVVWTPIIAQRNAGVLGDLPRGADLCDACRKEIDERTPAGCGQCVPANTESSWE